MTLLIHRRMLPNWLRKNATWNCSIEGDDLNLIIKKDSSDWENIFKLPVILPNVLDRTADITVNLKIGVVLPEPTQPRDPMSYMISDGDDCIGIQLMDPNHDYAKTGPYRAVEGGSARRLKNPNVEVGTTVSVGTNARVNPDQFDISFKPSEYFGSAYCALEDGHKIVAQYSDTLDLSKGLFLEMYRFKSTEVYTVNYIEMWVYLDSDAPLGQLPSTLRNISPVMR